MGDAPRRVIVKMSELSLLLQEIRACRHCEAYLPLGPRPVVRAASTARLLIVGQAPGTRVHATGIPWNDPSGDRLRAWLQLDRTTFYDESQVAILPMGFCYPGKGKSGDLPPRPECAPLWRPKLLPLLPNIQLTLPIGVYAQNYHLAGRQKANLTETVRTFHEYLPDLFPLPHPSPRNQFWLERNPWFVAECLPVLRARVAAVLNR